MTDTDAGAAAVSHPSTTDRAEGTIAWIGPFVVFAVWLLLDKHVPLANPWKEIVRDAVILGVDPDLLAKGPSDDGAALEGERRHRRRRLRALGGARLF